jgi:hypothetical protein
MIKTMGKRGRPSSYDQVIAAEICRRTADGESLRSICKDANMPSEACVRRWALDDVQGFFAQYDMAIKLRAARWAEEVLEISDEPPAVTGEGKYDSAYVQHQRLRVDSRKWLLSKVLPKVYGDKIDVTSAGEKVGFAIAIDLSDKAKPEAA